MELAVRAARFAARLAWRGMLERMLEDPVAVPIATAVSRALGGRPEAEAQKAVGAIEAKRKELRGLTDLVVIDDFGASKRDAVAGTKSARRREVKIGSFYQDARVDQISSRILFELVRELRPRRCIELGTCTGLSAAYQAAALALNGDGTLTTIEGDSTLAERAKETIRSLGFTQVSVRCGPFESELPLAAEELQPVDYVFNDGHHLEEPTVKYFETLLPFLANDATVVLDDINWSQGMRRAWKRLSSHPRVAVSVDLYRMGVLRLHGSTGEHERHYRWTLRRSLPGMPAVAPRDPLQ